MAVLPRFRLQSSAGPALLAAGLLLAPPLAGQAPTAPTPPIWIFFPPAPPVLGAARAPAAASAWPAPAALAAFLTEPFYAPLSAALKVGGGDPVLDAELEAYQADREALLAELRAQLDTLKDSDAEARRTGLAAFSSQVQPRVLGLERRAEQLRAELAAQGGGRNQYIRWNIDFADLTPAQATDRTLQSWRMEVDSYFLPGLSAAQRQLLREVALALRTPAGSGEGEALFFSPATSRIPLPAHPSAALQSDLDAYHRLKGQLEAALLDAAYPRSPADLNSRAAAIAVLARKQESGFASLEELAEKIRAALADLNDPDRTPDLAMPADLAAQIAAYRQEKLALQRDLLARVDALRRRPDPNSPPATPAEIREAIAAFTRENSARYAALNQSRDLIRDRTAKLAALPPDTGGAATGALQARFSASLRQLESYWDYHDYQIAVLQPGISPGLRRILLEGGLEKLSLPLPGAVMQPP